MANGITRFIQPANISCKPYYFTLAYYLGSDRLDLTKALALAAELEDKEIIRKMKIPEKR